MIEYHFVNSSVYIWFNVVSIHLFSSNFGWFLLLIVVFYSYLFIFTVDSASFQL